MAEISKVLEKLNDQEYVNELNKEFEESIHYMEYAFTVEGKPENYVRERKGKGGFYNPKGDEMKTFKNECLSQLSDDEKEELKALIEDTTAEYYVAINVTYYLPIPKGDSIKTSVKKELGFIRPAIRPDLDNYDKFLLDSLHDVLFDDDKRIININSEKRYSINPRTVFAALVIKK